MARLELYPTDLTHYQFANGTFQFVQQRGFAAAGGPEQDEELALIKIEIDTAQRMHRDLAHAIDLGDAARLEDDLPF